MKKRNLHTKKYQDISSQREEINRKGSKPYMPHLPNKKKIFGRIEIVAPRVFSLFGDNYSFFLDFIEDVKVNVQENNKVLINLSQVEDVKVSALLVFYANIEQSQKQYNSKAIIKTTVCKTRFISMIFEKFGIWKLTNEDRHRPVYPKQPGLELEICTASVGMNRNNEDSRLQLRKVINYTKKSLENTTLDDDNDSAFAAITESVSNVGQHAYDNQFFSEEFEGYLKNWWIIVHKIGDQLFISVYDMGAGIPDTISNKPGIQALISSIAKAVNLPIISLGDGSRIKAAVEYGTSRFKVDNRGKGLSEAKEFVANNPEGELLIYSGFGSYTFCSINAEEEVENLPKCFAGTLIQWNLKLENSYE